MAVGVVCGYHGEGDGGVWVVAGEEGLEVRVHCCGRSRRCFLAVFRVIAGERTEMAQRRESSRLEMGRLG